MHYAEKSEQIEFCVACNDPIEGLKLLSNSDFNVLFLDYNMPGITGKDLLKIKKDSSKVIMITSNIEFAAESYDYDVIVDYLLKPFDFDRFEKAVLKINSPNETEPTPQETDGNHRKTIMIKDGNSWLPLNIDGIRYIKSESNYCTFYTIDGKKMTLAKLTELESKLPPEFIRCHRSYIINTRFIQRINLEAIEFKDTTIPVSAKYKHDIKAFLDAAH
tara:strand:+ start:773 stop:1426 length:654 start_codon:yes stop_codon:yes gene_type:complete